MALFDEETWQRMLPKLKERCPRLTADDLIGCERRGDLLAGRIQNRHWVSRKEAQRIVLALMEECGQRSPA